MTTIDQNKLIEDYIPLVHSICRKYCLSLSWAFTYDEVFAFGCLGLVKAARTYDPSRGAIFKTYAYILIRGAIIDEIRQWYRSPIAVQNKPIDPKDPDKDVEIYFVNDRTPESELRMKQECLKLMEIVRDLTQRMQDVVQLYYFEELTMKEIGRKLHISEARVSQLNKQLISKLSIALKA